MYKRIWSPRTGQVLEASAETGNPEDRHAVIALQQTGEGVTLGHMPRKVSKVSWFFLRHGGCISCEITRRRKRSAVPGKGLEVPCIHTFTGKPVMIKKLIKLPEPTSWKAGFSKSHHNSKRFTIYFLDKQIQPIYYQNDSRTTHDLI